MDLETYDQRHQAQPASPRERGTVRLVVARKSGGKKHVLDEGHFSAAGGLDGDRWTLAKDPDRQSQITLMDAAVVRTLTDGDLVPTSGDNLLVDFDLSAAALAPGTRLRVGSAVLEVTPEPHDGCKKFAARFGKDAMRWVGRDKPARRRGIHALVVEDGVVRAGDFIERA